MRAKKLEISEQYELWDEYCKCKIHPRYFAWDPKDPSRLTKTEQYELWDEYCKLDSEVQQEEDFLEEEHEWESPDLDEYDDYREDFQEEHEELSVYDLAPEGMGYEYWSDDEYLGDVGYW